MQIKDINGWLSAPEGFTLQSFEAEGSFIHLVYTQAIYKESTTLIIGFNQVSIYLQQEGREVLRVHQYFPVEPSLPRKPIPTPSRWARFYNGFLLALYGIEEMFKCLKKQRR